MSKSHTLASNEQQNVRKREINVRRVCAGQQAKTCSKTSISHVLTLPYSPTFKGIYSKKYIGKRARACVRCETKGWTTLKGDTAIDLADALGKVGTECKLMVDSRDDWFYWDAGDYWFEAEIVEDDETESGERLDAYLHCEAMDVGELVELTEIFERRDRHDS